MTMLYIAISENILLFLSAFGLLQGLLLALLIYFHPQADKTVTTFLALYTGCISIPILMPVGQQLFTWQVIIFIEPFTLLIGPFLYLYVRSFKESITFKKAWPHFVLFPLFVVISFISYNQIGLRYPPSNRVPPEVISEPLSVYPVIIRLIQRFVYYFMAMSALRSYQRSIRHLFSEISRISLLWMRWVINGYLVVVSGTLVLYILILKYPEHFTKWVLSIGTLVTIYIYMCAFKGISQSTLWQVKPDLNKEKVEESMHEVEALKVSHNAEKQKEPREAATNARFMDIVSKIKVAMENERLYQEPELSLQELANRLQFPSYQVSQAINEGMNKNFYDLINNYRVEEAKRLLVDPKNKNYTILSVAFEAGFNSKTTFNTVFKKFTGQTPTDFKVRQGDALLTA